MWGKPFKSRLFTACRLQIGRVGTYRQVVHLTITVSRKVQDKVYIRTNIITYRQFCIKERVPAEPVVLTLFCFMYQSSRAIFKECGCNGDHLPIFCRLLFETNSNLSNVG